ncbi:hypothetical protein GS511_01220 [Leptospira borgpetersenii]|nr:hypothetical protein GS524_01225 [Leptospira borgpetersenii]QHE29057.1 hypothetical protein GS523_01225 [Leptospira borgpetersenii]QHE32359.1 hypothetical protein GS517_01220 [Leptospira borgpetersenii]QHE35657.1 hypothetical protein GS510_01220 [Leptospira borgpetersenii]QHE38941.1 hypothetical protein GS527_01500 [Leptospira borgpetersenii]
MKRFLRKRFNYQICEHSPELFYSAFQNTSLLCQKDQAARFCPSFGTEFYIEFTLM